MSDRLVKACEVADLDDDGLRVADIDGRAVLIARVGDDWFAVDDTCSHARVSLSAGIVDADDCTIECPKHGALFSLSTGEALTLPATRPIASHTIEVRDTEVFVALAEDDS